MAKLLQFAGRVGSPIGHPVAGFGYRPDPAGHLYTDIRHHEAPLFKTGAPLPAASNNLRFAPPVWNQGQTGSCTGHGMACVETLTLAAHGHSLSSPVCPRPRYMLGRAVDRTDPKQPLRDEGAAPNSLVRAAQLWGVVLESEDDGARQATSSDYTTYLQAHVNDDPKLGEIEHSLKRIFTDYKSIADNDPLKVLNVALALAGGYGVGVAVDAGSTKFQSYDGTGVLDYCGAEPDHWVGLIDYRTSSAGKLEFLLQNSWGVGLWTPDGRAWVTEDFVRRGCFNIIVPSLGV